MPYYTKNGQSFFVEKPELNPDLISGATPIAAPTQNIDYSKITASDLTTAPVNNFVKPAETPTPDISNIDTTITTPSTPAETKVSDLIQQITDTQNSILGEGAYKTEQQKALGVNELTAKQNDLVAQIQSFQTQSQALENQKKLAEERILQESVGRGRTAGGIAPLTADAQRRISLQQADIASQALIAQANLYGTQGKIATANMLVEQAVSAKFGAQKEKLAADIANLNILLKDPALDKATKDRAAAQLLAKEKQEAELKEKAKREEEKQKAVLEYSGIADSLTLAEMGKANSASEVAQIAQRKGLKTLEQQKKEQDIKYIQSQTAENLAQAQKAIAEAGSTGASGMSPTDLIAYAQQYASTGTIPTGLPKGTFGVVSQFAKELPKNEGEIVDNNTNIKSGKLTSTQLDAYGALRDLTKKLEEAKGLFSTLTTGLVGGTLGNIHQTQNRQAYNVLRGEIVDLLARARTGAAINASEEALYLSKVPGTFNKFLGFGVSGTIKLQGLQNSIAGKLESGLKANGVSMYGFSKIKLDGKEYAIGDVITINGLSGRILPDGTISIINQ